MKLDNKGFAISGILYAVMILFLTIIFSLLALISNRKSVLDKYKMEVKELINNSEETFGARIQLANNTSNIKMSENELANYDFKSNVAACLNANVSGPKNVLCRNNEVDISEILAYRIYDEVGNEIKFNFGEVTSGDYMVKIATYTYYDKSNGSYVLDPTETTLKTTTRTLDSTKPNKYYVKYSVVDNNNISAKEVTRTLIVNKYNYYINPLDNYFTVSPSEITTYDFKNKVDNYKYDGTNLQKSNSELKYVLYDSDNEIITEWKSAELKYITSSGTKNILSTSLFHVRYYVGELNSSLAQTKDLYFYVK